MSSAEPPHETSDSTASVPDRLVFGRYVIAGLINTAVSFVVYALAVSFTPAEYWLANLFATIAGVMCGFVLARIFVFKSSTSSVSYAGPRYIVTIALQYLVSTVAIGVLIGLGVHKIPAYILVLPIAIGVSYVLQKNWVFPAASAKK